MDSEEKVLTAIVCGYDDLLLTVNRGQALIFAICMLISVPCLIVTASLYLMVPELNDLHGKSLACHSFCLSLGFFLLAFSQLREGDFLEGTGFGKIFGNLLNCSTDLWSTNSLWYDWRYLFKFVINFFIDFLITLINIHWVQVILKSFALI